MIIGSLAGPLCAGGGFCAGTEEITEHQRLMAAAYTYSAALPALLATVACEVIQMLTSSPEMISQVREHTRLMWQQLDPRSDWVRCSSAPENPMMLLVFKPEVVAARKWGVHEQEQVMQEIVDEVSVSSRNVATSPIPPQLSSELSVAADRYSVLRTASSSPAARASPSLSLCQRETSPSTRRPLSRSASQLAYLARRLRRLA
jgi:Aminotransferase class I and II